MTDDDKQIKSMFDGVIETTAKPNGEVEVKLVSPSAEEVEGAVADFVRSCRDFRRFDLRPDAATDMEQPGVLWWRALEYLALADSRLKDIFCGRDRSPASIKQYHKYRLSLISGKRLRADA
jgi:hypothetical protein